ncbi:MAG TPA: dienelactone hydrolase family protein, partial [Ktedonobacteraceae bacterium]
VVSVIPIEQEDRMTGRMIEFDANGATAPGYLATPEGGSGPGIVVLHEWWGLTEPFKQACDRLAEAGFVALAPDFSRGKTTASIEEAEALGAELDRNVKRWRGDIVGALQFLRQHAATRPTDGRGAFGFVAFSTSRLLRAGYVDQSGRGDRRRRDLLCHLSWPGLPRCESGLPVPRGFGGPLRVGGVRRGIGAAGRQTTFYTYPGTRHWFFDANRVEAYDASAAALAWERTVAFLNAELRR